MGENVISVGLIEAAFNCTSVSSVICTSQMKARRTNDNNKLAEILRKTADDLYYHAKNVVYSYPTYYDEMTVIRHRMVFSRSLSTISVFLLSLTVCGCLVRKLMIDRGISKRVLRPSPDIENGKYRSQSLNFPKELPTLEQKHICLPLVFVFFWGTSVVAYTAEQRELILRAFGYFTTLELEVASNDNSSTGGQITALNAPLPYKKAD